MHTARATRLAANFCTGTALVVLAIGARPIASTAQWVEPPGQGWASVTGYYQNTRDAYDIQGDVNPFPGNGHAISMASFLTLALGIVDGIDGWAQFSFQRLRFNDFAGRRTSTGPGDTRLYLRGSPLRLLGIASPVAIRAGVKLPLGDFDVGSNIIPLGDGQRDWELMVELGHSFYPSPVYAMGWLGYRWRDETDDGRDFGDERFFYTAVGGEAGPIGFKVGMEGWFGKTPVFFGLPAVGAEREMFRIHGSLLLNAGPGQVELGTRVPLSGKNLPAGTDLVVGYFTRIGF